jgi:hypothetical protein
MLPIPTLLIEMIAARRWPANEDDERAQNLKYLAPPDRVRLIAPEESVIYLYSPPFYTVRERSNTCEREFWKSPMAAAKEIDYDLALDIGDFGLGSDAPILLDYRANACEPRVIRLQWPRDGTTNPNHWVEAAPSFLAFVNALGL